MSAAAARGARPRTLAIDIGGTVLKAVVLDRHGRPLVPPIATPTPRPSTRTAVLAAVRGLAAAGPRFDRVAVGFPGVVVNGIVRSAANLHRSWIGADVADRVCRLTARPTRVANDADVHGMAVFDGKGVELVITLGTGVGSALFIDGTLVPNLELGHHPFRDGRTYEQLLGDRALKSSGKALWLRRLRVAVKTLQQTFNCRRLYLGGGNARLVVRGFAKGVVVVNNVAGLLGGFRLWEAKR